MVERHYPHIFCVTGGPIRPAVSNGEADAAMAASRRVAAEIRPDYAA
jgi:hypothetical protein